MRRAAAFPILRARASASPIPLSAALLALPPPPPLAHSPACGGRVGISLRPLPLHFAKVRRVSGKGGDGGVEELVTATGREGGRGHGRACRHQAGVAHHIAQIAVPMKKKQ